MPRKYKRHNFSPLARYPGKLRACDIRYSEKKVLKGLFTETLIEHYDQWWREWSEFKRYYRINRDAFERFLCKLEKLIALQDRITKYENILLYEVNARRFTQASKSLKQLYGIFQKRQERILIQYEPAWTELTAVKTINDKKVIYIAEKYFPRRNADQKYFYRFADSIRALHRIKRDDAKGAPHGQRTVSAEEAKKYLALKRKGYSDGHIGNLLHENELDKSKAQDPNARYKSRYRNFRKQNNLKFPKGKTPRDY
jgi:hypothetical protein